MNTSSQQLLSELIAQTEKATATVRAYRDLSSEQLNFKPGPESWSILECLEHLNLYGDFYLPEMERRILAAKPVSNPGIFRSGLIGNYFANLMKPGKKMIKMQSTKDKNPVHAQSTLSAATIDRFLKQQDHLLRLLQLAKKVDLTRTKTAISISKMIKLRLGDTFRFYVYHIERHVAQAEKLK